MGINYFLKGLYETKLFSCHSVFYPYGLSAYQNFDSCVWWHSLVKNRKVLDISVVWYIFYSTFHIFWYNAHTIFHWNCKMVRDELVISYMYFWRGQDFVFLSVLSHIHECVIISFEYFSMMLDQFRWHIMCFG